MSTLRRWLAAIRPLVPPARRRASEAWHYARGLERSAWRRVRNVPPRYVAGAVVLSGVLLLAVVVDTVSGVPGADEIRTIGQMPVATTVFDRDDTPAFTIFQERRYEVPLEAISPNLVNAVLAIEDQRFYDHHGIDPWRIAGSVWANLRSGEFAQGGSTITQQLARQSFLTLDKTIRRKLKEAYLAWRIEGMYSKPEILELYLNKVYFGSGLYGAEAAARGYFNTSAADLTVDEAALIAGLIQAPSAYAPGEHLDRAVRRRAVVLGQMVAAGTLDRTSARLLAAMPVTLSPDDGHATGAWFKQAVTRELVDRFGWDLVSQGGLRVYTTLDPDAQRAAEEALTSGLTRIEKLPAFRHRARADLPAPAAGTAPAYLQGALVALDPATGEVRALVGGRDFTDSQFDRVTQAHRQSGSAFKPFVYATALELGYTPATVITNLDQPIPTPEGPWLPDDGHDDTDAMTVRTALRVSSNRAAAQMLQTVGIDEAVDEAHRFGLDVPAVPSLVLGSGDVTLMGLTEAYGTFADAGRLHQARLIRRVEDATGAVLMETHDDAHRVLSEQTAFQMASILADVVDHGTGYQARLTGFDEPAAGKTGTTNDYKDAWFVGFTPDLVAGVWVGFDQPRTIVPGGYASQLAVPIWGTFMKAATSHSKGEWLEQPPDVVAVEVCQVSGLLPNAACRRVHTVNADGEDEVQSMVRVEYFRRGTEPTETCPLHGFSWLHGVQTASFNPGDFPASAIIGTPPPRPDAHAAAVVTDDAGEQPDPEARDGGGGEKRGFWSRVFGVFGGGGDDRDKGDQDRSRRPPGR